MDRAALGPLTGLRFFLALWVLLFHDTGPGEFLAPLRESMPAALDHGLRTGYAAVSAFFVLSGFVLAYRYPLDTSWSRERLREYAWARVARLYPVYLLALIVIAPYWLWMARASGGWPQVAAELPSGLASALLLQAWVPPWALRWNGPGWSLSAEAFFYVCFPWLGAWIWKRPNTAGCGLGLWAASLAAPLLAVLLPVAGLGDRMATTAVDGASNWVQLAMHHPLVRLPEFLAGILAARWWERLSERGAAGRGYRLYVPAAIALAVVLANAHRLPYPLAHQGALLPLWMALIVGLALDGGTPARWLASKPLVVAGNASYALYILQAPLHAAMVILVRRWTGARPAGLWAEALFVLLCVAASLAVYRWFEEPLRRRLRRSTHPRARQAVANLDMIESS